MKFTSLYSMVCLAFLATAMVTCTTRSTAQTPKQEGRPAVFDGKLVTIYTNEKRTGGGCVLKNPKFEEIGGRLMLVGPGADTGTEGNWTVGVQIGVAWDSITMYYAMTPEQFEAKREKHAK